MLAMNAIVALTHRNMEQRLPIVEFLDSPWMQRTVRATPAMASYVQYHRQLIGNAEDRWNIPPVGIDKIFHFLTNFFLFLSKIIFLTNTFWNKDADFLERKFDC